MLLDEKQITNLCYNKIKIHSSFLNCYHKKTIGLTRIENTRENYTDFYIEIQLNILRVYEKIKTKNKNISSNNISIKLLSTQGNRGNENHYGWTALMMNIIMNLHIHSTLSMAIILTVLAHS